MIDLILAILFFNVILVIFKLFDRYNVNTLQAIVTNYLVAGSCGIYFSTSTVYKASPFEYDWIPFAICVGFFFILVFNLLAAGTQKVGLAISTVANKMSLILPVVASFFLYDDHVSTLKIVGILCAVIGVILTTTQAGKLNFDFKYIWLILIIFFGQGIADIIFNYAQQNFVDSKSGALFIAYIFLSAFAIGIVVLIIQAARGILQLRIKNVLWGIAIGVPNFLSVFYFFKALESEVVQSSQAYPILNMGVIIISAVAGFILFGEKISLRNWIGVLLSIAAIAAIGFS
ncbi:DMT family transporter [Crocinitomix algicola]|uniref:DMT family transporter n=1 Tax=Crocinitomix algicola TaxID=1740263 RepID=UPI0008368021|nr:DMT family transporter [Crocinitomix algicola]